MRSVSDKKRDTECQNTHFYNTFFSPTDAQLNTLKNNFKFTLKFTLKGLSLSILMQI